MEVVGKIIQAFPETSGVSSKGNSWKKREYVLETFESFPRKIFFDFFGDRADQFPLNPNDSIRLSFDIESREYNGRWYTSIRGWKAEPYTEGAPVAGAPAPAAAFPQPQAGFGAAPAAAPAPAVFPSAPASFPGAPAEASNDELPF